MENNPKKGLMIIISSVHWNFTWQRHHDIASGFANIGYQVYFIEPIPKRWPRLNEAGRVFSRLFRTKKGGGLCSQEAPDNVTILRPILLPDTSKLTLWINKHVLIPLFLHKNQGLCSHSRRYVINYLPIPTALNLHLALKPTVSAYDCVTDWKNSPYTKTTKLIEDKLLESVDIVFADSQYLYKNMLEKHKRVFRALPAVHYKLFKEARQKKIKPCENLEPIVGYFGTVGPFIDVELLREVSHRYRLSVIGPLKLELNDFSPKTKFFGPVSHKELPSLLSNVDIILLPYQKVHMPFPSVIPAKTFECLATGKPTITIGLESLKEFSNNFYICENKNDVFDALDLVIDEPHEERYKRLELARKNDWTIRIKEIEAYFIENEIK